MFFHGIVTRFASPLDDVISSSHGVENSSMVIWGQGMNAFPDHAVLETEIQRQQQFPFHWPKQEYAMVSNENYNLISYQGAGNRNPEGQVLCNIDSRRGISELNHDQHVNWAVPSQISCVGEGIPFYLYPSFPLNDIHKGSNSWEGAQISDAEVWNSSGMNVNFPNMPHFG